jgi:hypothetical protein
MIKRYVHDMDRLTSMTDEEIHKLYYKVEWLIGNSDSIEYIQKVIKRWNTKEKEL